MNCKCQLILFLVMCAVQPVSSGVIHVSVASGSDTNNGLSWGAAKASIQAAVDAASTNDQVVVSNGVYEVGGHAVFGDMTNRVAITKPILVRSVNGPLVTSIRGSRGSPAVAVRCVYVTNGAVLSGFTLTNGSSRWSGDLDLERSGGGVWSEPLGCVTNCIITDNLGYSQGGGSFGGMVYNTLIKQNSATRGGGAYGGTLYHCIVSNNAASDGGGSYGANLNSCLITENSAGRDGGGLYYGAANSCTISGNYSPRGGGVVRGTLNNCVVHKNSADYVGGAVQSRLDNCSVVYNTAFVEVGGVIECNVTNSIVYFNDGENHQLSSFVSSCATPYPGGTGNISNNPVFVNGPDGDYQLASTSPCIDAGLFGNTTASNDLAGNDRVVNFIVDMGAYEYQGVVTNDTDGDEVSNVDELVSGTDWTDPTDYLTVCGLQISETGVICFESTTGRLYAVERGTAPATAFQIWTDITNAIPGTGSQIAVIDSETGTAFQYRVRVRRAP